MATGFPNMGNTCYFNSITQCLLSCTSLRRVLANTRERNALAEALHQLYEQPGTAFAQWYSAFRNLGKFTGGRQEDAS